MKFSGYVILAYPFFKIEGTYEENGEAMIKGAVFDADGVLLDSMSVWMDAGARYLKNLSIEAEPGLRDILWAMSLSESAAYLKRQYRLPFPEEEILQGVLGTVRDYYYYDAALKDGARKFLEALSEKGIPMAVASTSEKGYLERAFARHGIRKYFRGIVTSAEAGAGKTEPAIYRMAAELLDAAPAEIFVFEDALYAVRTANMAGFQTVGIYDRFSEEDQEMLRQEADVYLTGLTDFEAFWETVSKERK